MQQENKLNKNSANNFANEMMEKWRKRIFIGYLFTVLIGYVGITLLLNAIRANVPIWIVWILIIIQFLLYLLIFHIPYARAVECGFNKTISEIIFIILAILGRINDWELLIIPLITIIMIIVSAKNKIKS